MLTSVPLWRRSIDDHAERPIWIPVSLPPPLHTRVRILAWGEPYICGDVEGYEVTHGYLMIWVRPDIRPEWHLRDNPNRDVCLFAGIELEWPVT